MSTILAFFAERATAIERLLVIPYTFRSVLVAPLEVFPKGVRAFAVWTPLPCMIHVPAQQLAGGEVDILPAFGVMTLWLLVLYLQTHASGAGIQSSWVSRLFSAFRMPQNLNTGLTPADLRDAWRGLLTPMVQFLRLTPAAPTP